MASAVTYADFIVKFPEFAKATQALVQAHLDQATLLVSEDAFDTLYEVAVGYLAAHLLALSPFAQQMRLVAKDGSTTYGTYYREHILPRVARRGAVL